MEKYNITITGEGTAEEIAQALRDVADGIMEAKRGEHEVAVLDGAEWEDSVLMTRIQNI